MTGASRALADGNPEHYCAVPPPQRLSSTESVADSDDDLVPPNVFFQHLVCGSASRRGVVSYSVMGA